MVSSNGSNGYTATTLVSGILGDFQELIQQQFALIRAECAADLQKTKQAGLLVGLSMLPLGCGTMLLAFMLAHLLHWSTLPAGSETAGLPLWGSYGIVGSLLVIAGGVLFLVGWRKLQSLNPLAGESVQALEENVHWLKARVSGGNRLQEANPWSKRSEFPTAPIND